jgi:putative N-acetylmannosamine-6-phosphate epimerase
VTLADLLVLLRDCPVVASVQAGPDSPLEDPQTLVRLARASVEQGVRLLRSEGSANIHAIRAAAGVPVIGLIKRSYERCPIYITPSEREVEETIAAGADLIALDGTARPRPSLGLRDLISIAHKRGKLVLADCDNEESVEFSLACGADLVSTTLSGYTEASLRQSGPDMNLLRKVCRDGRIVLAEGRYQDPWQVRAALRIGANGIVIGGALNDPVKATRRFLQAIAAPADNVGAVDLGGTWLRFGVFSPDWQLIERTAVPRQDDPQARTEWIKAQVQAHGVSALGVASGGVVNPKTGVVVKAKSIIPNHVGTAYDEDTMEVPTTALNDGLALAWGHACHPRFAGQRVATLALGTGVGFGLVDRGRLLMGSLGAPPNVADLPFQHTTIEQTLGGASYDSHDAPAAIGHLIEIVRSLFHPDEIVVCGSIASLPEIKMVVHEKKVHMSPFGEHAGLYGAAALALFPPDIE